MTTKYTKMYQEFDSTFHSNGKDYDLNKVFAIVHEKEVWKAFVPTLKSYLYEAKICLGTTDWNRVNNTDLQYPIIVSDYQKRLIIVDGWHRFQKAWCLYTSIIGIHETPTIPVKYITPEELETTII